MLLATQPPEKILQAVEWLVNQTLSATNSSGELPLSHAKIVRIDGQCAMIVRGL